MLHNRKLGSTHTVKSIQQNPFNKEKEICRQGMDAVMNTITATTAKVGNDCREYVDNPGCCQIFASYFRFGGLEAKSNAMEKFLNDIVIGLVFHEKQIQRDVFNQIVGDLIENGAGTCNHQVILLALFLLENGLATNNISIACFRNLSNLSGGYNPAREGHTMICVKLSDDKELYLDPLTGNNYENQEIYFRVTCPLKGLDDSTYYLEKYMSLDILEYYIDSRKKPFTNKMTGLKMFS